MSATRRFRGLLGVLAVSLTGCTFSAAPLSASPDQTEPAPVSEPCPTERPVPWGDTIAQARIKDKHGVYCHVTVDPRSPALDYDSTIVKLELVEWYGFTRDDAVHAQQTAVAFVAEVMLDSPFLDSTIPEGQGAASIIEWLPTTGYQFAYPPTGGLVYSGELPVLIRDGGPRSAATYLTVTEVTGQGGKTGYPVVAVSLLVESFYRMSDETAVAYMLDHGYEGTRQQLVLEHPEYADGQENVLPVTSTINLNFNSQQEILRHDGSHRAADAVIDARHIPEHHR